MSLGSRRRVLSDEERAANAAARAAREKAAMTCQVCGRQILANTGVIAHHGYRRPGDGWQTESCIGAKRLPFEVDRAALGEEITAIELHLAKLRETRGKIEREESDVVRQYSEQVGYQTLSRVVMFNRANFDDIVAAKPEAFRFMGVPRFDECKRQHLAALDYSISQAEAYLARQRGRFNGWKQTHERRDDRWVRLSKSSRSRKE